MDQRKSSTMFAIVQKHYSGITVGIIGLTRLNNSAIRSVIRTVIASSVCGTITRAKESNLRNGFILDYTLYSIQYSLY